MQHHIHEISSVNDLSEPKAAHDIIWQGEILSINRRLMIAGKPYADGYIGEAVVCADQGSHN